MKPRLIRASLSPLLALSVLAGCGYSSERPFRDDIQSVHVKMFESKEFRRDLEFQLTEALVKRIEMETPYDIADQNKADTVFSGEIIEVRNRMFGQDFGTRLPRETGSTIVMAFRWKDQRTGEILSERKRFVSTTSYIPAIGETFETGMIRGLDRLAEEIVETAIESPW